MFLRDTYYLLKPFIPRPVRVALRRGRAKIKLRSMGADWLYAPNSHVPPAGWQGWPQGKKFAFALSHDVEGQLGVDRTPALMQTEKQLGARSSFNFIPEGEYRVSAELRKELTTQGFEVGIHDLHHDGKLYLNREAFVRNAKRINEYVKEWQVVGFRAGFMLHNLEWLKDLNVLYDASTFDVDPFEPQPDGVGTIFPFAVSRADGTCYIELPYTILQDFTMFTILQQQHIDLWKKKIDWVAERGGMVLVNVHPDYVHFGAGRVGFGEFPVRFYEELITYVQKQFAGQYWHALPREIAAHAAACLKTYTQMPPGAAAPLTPSSDGRFKSQPASRSNF